MRSRKVLVVGLVLVTVVGLLPGLVLLPALANGPGPEPRISDIDESPTSSIDEIGESIDDLLSRSGWEGYSSTDIENREALIVSGTSSMPDALFREAQELAGGFPLEQRISKIRMSEYNRRLEWLQTAVGQDAPLLALVSATGQEKVVVELVDTGNVDDVEKLVREAFRGLPLEVTRVDAEKDDGYQPAAGRWYDKTPYYGGAEIHSGGVSCTSGFSAKRKSDNQRVLITAWHCNTLNLEPGDLTTRNWRTGYPNTSLGKGTSAGFPGQFVDAMYILPTSGTTFGSGMYVGGWQNDLVKKRKSAKDPAGIGYEVRVSGARSGGVVQVTTAVNIIHHGSLGFFSYTSDGQARVGSGDSGSPNYAAHDDGTYSARGLFLSKGKIRTGDNAFTNDIWRQCVGGDPSRGVECSRYTFSANISKIESALGVDIYPS